MFAEQKLSNKISDAFLLVEGCERAVEEEEVQAKRRTGNDDNDDDVCVFQLSPLLRSRL